MIKLKGKRAVVSYLERVKKSVRQQAGDALAGSALQVAAMAKSRLQPKTSDGDEIVDAIVDVRQHIGAEIDRGKLEATVFAGGTSQDDMAAYLEFGTGDSAAAYLATQPSWVKEWAANFIKNKKGTITDHAYLIPSLRDETPELIEKLKKINLNA